MLHNYNLLEAKPKFIREIPLFFSHALLPPSHLYILSCCFFTCCLYFPHVSFKYSSFISHLQSSLCLYITLSFQHNTVLLLCMCVLSGASSLSSGRAVQVAFMHTHTYTHTEDENLCHSLSHRCPH